MNSDKQRHKQASLIIRAWEDGITWHFRVQDIVEDQQYGFASIEALLQFLDTYFREYHKGDEK